MKILSVFEDPWDQQKETWGYRKSNTDVLHDFCSLSDNIKVLKLINFNGGVNETWFKLIN